MNLDKDRVQWPENICMVTSHRGPYKARNFLRSSAPFSNLWAWTYIIQCVSESRWVASFMLLTVYDNLTNSQIFNQHEVSTPCSKGPSTASYPFYLCLFSNTLNMSTAMLICQYQPERRGRKLSNPNSRHYTEICLKRLRKTTTKPEAE
jgi:hypothetical protein